MTNLKNKFKSILEENFNAVKQFTNRFSHISTFYEEDMNFDENEIRKNEKCDIFRKWCERYRTEEKEINNIVQVQPLGIFHIQLERFITSALPAPNQKQEIIAEVLPRYEIYYYCFSI